MRSYIYIYTPSETDIYLTSASHTFDFAMSELTALHVVYAVSQPVLLQLHRLALRMQEMLPKLSTLLQCHRRCSN